MRQNISACLKLNRLRLVIVHCYITFTEMIKYQEVTWLIKAVWENRKKKFLVFLQIVNNFPNNSTNVTLFILNIQHNI